MRLSLSNSAIVPLLLPFLLLTGCDILSPSENEIPGAYEAVLLTTPSGTVTFDEDTEGSADLLLVLHEDGTTTGYAYLPNGIGTGGVIDIDLAGVWYAGQEGVLLSLAADSFLEQMFFNRRENLLIGVGGTPPLTLELERRE